MSDEVADISSLAVAIVPACSATSSEASARAAVVFCTRITESRTRSATLKNLRMALLISCSMVLKALASRGISPVPETLIRTERSPAAAFSMASTIASSGLKAWLHRYQRTNEEPSSRIVPRTSAFSRLPVLFSSESSRTASTTTVALPVMIRAVNVMVSLRGTVSWRRLACQPAEIGNPVEQSADGGQ